MGLGKTTVISDDEEDEIEPQEEPEDIAGDDDEEDDEEGADEFENDGFIVDDEEEQEDEPEEERRKRKRKKKRESEKTYVLDEDDYELLQDNNAGFQRPKPGSKFKRLKKAGRDDLEGTSSLADEDMWDKTGRSRQEKLKKSLFGDDEDQQLDDIAEEDEEPEEDDGLNSSDDNDMSDFIVDGDIDENGAPVRRKKSNKKKFRPAPGVSSSALLEAHEIFGDVDELLMLRKQGLSKSGRNDELGENRLEEEFEPFILSGKYMTEKDYRIRDIDVPERIQVLKESTGPIPTDELSMEDESVWIHNQLISNYKSLFTHGEEIPSSLSKNIKEDISRFLELWHVDKYDIPFISMYRKENCPTLLSDLSQEEIPNEDTRKLKWHQALWIVKDLDKKWLLLQKRKSALQTYYGKRYEEESRQIYDEARLSLNRQLYDSIIESLTTAETEREVDDVDLKFNLHFPPGEVGVEEGQFRRPKRISQYSICSKAGLWEVASKIGYSSEKLGLLINLEKMIDPLDDSLRKETPEDIASNFTCAMFETPQAVLQGARHMATVEISYEPRVRKHVRAKFLSEAFVSTSPTADGSVAIDSFHRFAGVKWLRDKPVKEFKDSQWLLIQKAEEEKLLQVTIKLPQDRLDVLINEVTEYYLSDGVSAAAKLWNEQRSLILQDAFTNFLLPSMEKEVRCVLTTRAKHYLVMEYGKNLWKKVSVRPYQRKETDDETARKVLGCCWGRGNPATTFVMLDAFGEVVDTLEANYISSRSQNVSDQQRKKNDQQRLLKFVNDNKPQVVVLGAVNLNCNRLKDEIYEIIWKAVEEDPRDIGEEMADTNVFFGDETLPRLFENSRVSLDQLPGHPGIVKRATALGRYLQNPLAMVATLCGPEREILSWKLHPSEDFLTPDEKYEMVEQVMVDVTNQVGIDLNLAASHEWLFSPLQFVSGLGPRKAASLQKALVRRGAIGSRKDLHIEFLNRKVFLNSVAFLRVRRTGLGTGSSQMFDLLDDTRIHPESYELAKHMAKDVFDEDNEDASNDDDDEVKEMAIEHVRNKPAYLKRLDINEYAISAEERYDAINKKETLCDIRLELLQGFRDWRTPYKQPEQDEAFYMLTGETEDSLAVGRMVQVTVRRVLPQRAYCDLESRLTGFLNADDYSDTGRPEDLTLELNEGAILTCKIKEVEMNRYLVYLTCKESELKRDHIPNLENMDPFYKPDLARIQSEHEKARKEKELAKKKHFKPRMIVHPRFMNITTDEATEFLSDKAVGESIIHPSYQGPAFLTLTLKVYDDVYAHKEIAESGKDHKDITSLLRLGKTLKIGDDNFEDLDEVMDRYVDPLVTQLKSMLAYRKFRRGTKAEVDELLRNEKSENPRRIVYCFGISHDYPGAFILTYIRNTNPHHELVSLHAKGFKFRKRAFEEIDRLVAYFQKHIDDPPQDSAQSIHSVAAMVPMRGPAGGESSGSGWGSFGASDNDGGWGEKSGGRGRGRGRGRGGGSGSGGDSCYKCGEQGHMARDCTQGGGGGGGGNCYKCGEQGHMAKDCTQGGGGGGGGNCYKCGEQGHMARDCTQGGGGGSGGGGNCYKCGEQGHMARECTQGGGGGGGGGGGNCYKCGEQGHMARECTQGGGGSGGGGNCYKCGEQGHIARDCTQGGSGGGGGSCYKCGEQGHMARDCTQGGGRGGYNGTNETGTSGFGSSSWTSGPKDDNDGWGSFPGAKTQNSPGREAFPGGSGSAGGVGDGWGGSGGWGGGSGGGATVGGGGGWGSSGGATDGGGGWSSGTGTDAGAGGGKTGGGWGSADGGKTDGGGWGSAGGGKTDGGGGWGSAGGGKTDGGCGWGSAGGGKTDSGGGWGSGISGGGNVGAGGGDVTAGSDGGWGSGSTAGGGNTDGGGGWGSGGTAGGGNTDGGGGWGSVGTAGGGNADGGGGWGSGGAGGSSWGAGGGNTDGGGSGQGGWGSGRGREGGQGRGRGRGPGSYQGRGNNDNNQKDTGFGSSSWTSVSKDNTDGFSSFPGAKVQNSPGREAFPGGGSSGWASGGSSWGNAGSTNTWGGNSDPVGDGGDGWSSGAGKGGWNSSGTKDTGVSGGGVSCYKCGEPGHMSRDCPQGGGGRGGGGGGNCYKCGEPGHIARDCSQGGAGGGGGSGSGSCYKCGEQGHIARDCTQGGGGGRGGGGGGNCYKCGEQGHIARDCTSGSGGIQSGWGQ